MLHKLTILRAASLLLVAGCAGSQPGPAGAVSAPVAAARNPREVSESTTTLTAAPAALSTGKTVVLVHGAFADGSSWAKVIPLLRSHGLNVVAVQNPLSSLAADVDAAKRVIDQQQKPVILVGHSWGGAVITEAGNNDKVSALVYVAAFAPGDGQSAGDMTKASGAPVWASGVRPDAGGYLTLSRETILKHFAPDIDPAEAEIVAATQGAIGSKAFDEKITNAAWKTKPSSFIVASQDHMIPPDVERAEAKRMNATTVTLGSSHVPMLSHPQEVANVIIAAADSAK